MMRNRENVVIGMLLYRQGCVDVPFAGSIEGVIRGALVAVSGVMQEIPADGALKDEGQDQIFNVAVQSLKCSI
jgi:hypothetical protein